MPSKVHIYLMFLNIYKHFYKGEMWASDVVSHVDFYMRYYCV